jgi:hypothetical protein
METVFVLPLWLLELSLKTPKLRPFEWRGALPALLLLIGGVGSGGYFNQASRGFWK